MKEQLIRLVKEVKFPTFPGGTPDVSVEYQLPDHAIEAIANHLISNGVTMPVRSSCGGAITDPGKGGRYE